MSREVVALGPNDREQAWRLGALAFGGDLRAGPPPTAGPPRSDSWGVRDDRGRLVAKAALLDHEQWWGGRPLRSGGVAGVAVHPDARGTGAAALLLAHLLEVMRERGQVVSALFPTVPGLYRRYGWETVGSLDETRLPTVALAGVEPSPLRVRSAEPADAPGLAALYSGQAEAGAGGLVRAGRAFPDAPELPSADVVSVVDGPGGALLGYCSYDRGRGYDRTGCLTVHELVSADRAATAALLGSLGSWHPVAPTTVWHGPTTDLALLLPTPVPAPDVVLPWMLRLVDPVGAVAARGWAADLDVAFRLTGPDGAEQAWRLQVVDGEGSLAPAPSEGPLLHLRGLALLWAGAPVALVRRAGLLDGPLPGLEAALAGPPPVLLDYF